MPPKQPPSIAEYCQQRGRDRAEPPTHLVDGSADGRRLFLTQARNLAQQCPWLYERPACLAGGRRQAGAMTAELERGSFLHRGQSALCRQENLRASGSLKPLREGTGGPMPRFILPR